ncbi:MAG: hypothetical protein PHF00_05145 [Elusimicrobia bacterium]|nr:hypothetical protein [Elusimicrobiota bacterium]
MELGVVWVLGAFGIAGAMAAEANHGQETPPFVEDEMRKNPESRDDYIDDEYPEEVCAATVLHLRDGKTKRLECADWSLSPDRNYAALGRYRGELGLFIVDMGKGAVKRHILLDASKVSPYDEGPKCGGLRWSPDSRHVAFTVLRAGKYPTKTKLFIDDVSADRHAVVAVDSLEGHSDQGYWFFDPTWSADSRVLAIFESFYGTDDKTGRLSFFDPQGRRLISHPFVYGFRPGGMRWEKEGVVEVYSSSDDQVVSFDVGRDPSGKITLSPRPPFVAIQGSEPGAELHLPAGRSIQVRREKADVVRWSPDRKQVAFQASGDEFGLFVADMGDGSVRCLLLLDRTAQLGNTEDLAWSPDGRALAFVRCHREWSPERTDLFIVDVAAKTHAVVLGNSVGALTPDISCSLYKPEWSPDSKHIAILESKHYQALGRYRDQDIALIDRNGSRLASFSLGTGAGYSLGWAKDGLVKACQDDGCMALRVKRDGSTGRFSLQREEQ